MKAGPYPNVECLNHHDLARMPRLENAVLLDIDAILSHATPGFSMPNPELAKALAHTFQARDKILE